MIRLRPGFTAGFVNFMVKLLLAFAFNHLLFLLFNPRNRRNPRINSFCFYSCLLTPMYIGVRGSFSVNGY
jgi:hypothetical protein